MAGGQALSMPTTWPHGPTLRREVFSCRLGAVHAWRIAPLIVQSFPGQRRAKTPAIPTRAATAGRPARTAVPKYLI
jgi:hypothetical protein